MQSQGLEALICTNSEKLGAKGAGRIPGREINISDIGTAGGKKCFFYNIKNINKRR